MDLKGKKLILSSASPRRKELLEGLGLDFTIDTGTSFIEQYAPGTPLEQIPALMAEGKSEGFHRQLAMMRFFSPQTPWYIATVS